MLNRGVDPTTASRRTDFRPLKGFSDLNLATNKGYSNYNAMQLTWIRTQRPLPTVNMNYTFGKAMGIVYNNWGTPPYDHVQHQQQLRVFSRPTGPHTFLHHCVFDRIGDL